MFPGDFDQTLNCHPIWIAFSEMVFMGVDGLLIWFRKITPRHTFYRVLIRLSKVLGLLGGMICFIRSEKILRSG